jgi:DegV family protein with EDD domain
MASGSTVRIVVDSTASMPDRFLEDLGVTVVPVAVQIGDRTYDDGVDLTREEFYRALESGARPLTSQPAPGTFYDVYRRLLADDPSSAIVSIHLTGKHSGTVQSAKLAAEMFPGQDIEVVDSGFTSAALGLLTMVAAHAARLGQSKREILDAIEDARQRILVYVCVPTLEYLRRSGRVSFAQAALADILSIKPILTMRHGLLEVAEKVRTYRRALERAVDMVEEQVGRAKLQIAIVHANAPEAAEEFRRQVEERLNVMSAVVADIGSALAAHGGPGMLGLACLRL